MSEDYLKTMQGPVNRYRLTEVHTDDAVRLGERRLGLWKPVFPTLLNSTVYQVAATDLKRIDLIAARAYGDPRLWWIIAWMNKIKNPLTDLYVGQTLLIPSLSSVTELFSGK